MIVIHLNRVHPGSLASCVRTRPEVLLFGVCADEGHPFLSKQTRSVGDSSGRSVIVAELGFERVFASGLLCGKDIRSFGANRRSDGFGAFLPRTRIVLLIVSRHIVRFTVRVSSD